MFYAAGDFRDGDYVSVDGVPEHADAVDLCDVSGDGEGGVAVSDSVAQSVFAERDGEGADAVGAVGAVGKE